MLRSRMGFGLLALLMFGSTSIISMIHPSKANALLPGGGSGPGVTLTMIDAAHIGVIGNGTVSINGEGSFDLTQVTGVYFDSNAVHDGSDWPVQRGQEYYRNGLNQATCPGAPDSKVTISNGTPGSLTASVDIWLPETGTNTPGHCIEVSKEDSSLGFNNVSISDLSLTGNINTFSGDPASVCGRSLCGGIIPLNLGAYASTTLFFEQTSGEITEVGADSSISGSNGGQQYIYSQKSNGNFTENNSPSADCPNYISPITATGLYVKATYHMFGKAQGQPCGTGTPYEILVLTESPTAYFAGISNGSTGGSGNAAPPDNCPITNWALRWLVCPVVDVINGAIALINSYIGGLLIIPTSYLDAGASPGKSFFAAWGDFRDLAVSLFVIAALIMVIGESAGFDLLDAYSIRKILPRLLTGGVAITLSWIICTFAIQLDNNLINWLPDMILSPFQGLGSTANLNPGGALNTADVAGGVAAGATMGAAAVGAIVLLGVPAILSLILSLFIALIAAFVTLTIRMMILVLWLITSPLWIACYILPTTQKGFTFGRDAGVTAMVAGLIAAGILAASQLVALVALAAKGVVPIFAPAAIVIGEGMLFKIGTYASGLIGQAGGAIHGVRGGLSNGIKGYRKNKLKDNTHKIQEGKRFSGTNPVGRALNPMLQRAALTPKGIAQSPFNPKRWRTNVTGSQGTAEFNEGSEIMEKDTAFKAISKDDTKLWAIMETTGAGRQISGLGDSAEGVRQSLINHKFSGTEEEREIVVSQIMAAKKSAGNGQGLLQAAIRAQGGTGTGYDDAGQMMRWIDIGAGENTNAVGEMVGEMRPAAVQSGRVDLGGGGFGDTMKAYGVVHRARLGLSPLNAAGKPTGGPALTAAQAVSAATETILDSAIDGNGSAQQAHGKPQSAAALASQHGKRLTRLMGEVDAAAAGVNAGTHTEQQLRTAQRNADQQLAAIMGLYDTIGHESPLNQRAFADGLMGTGMLDATNLRSADVTAAAQPITRNVSILQLGEMRTNDVAGTTVLLGPAVGMGPPNAVQVRSNNDFRETRRDYGTASAAAGAGATGVPPAGGGGAAAGGP